jgi:hypothetical protein
MGFNLAFIGLIIPPTYSVNQTINIRTLAETYCWKRKTAVAHNHIALKEHTEGLVVKLHEFCTIALDGGFLDEAGLVSKKPESSIEENTTHYGNGCQFCSLSL